MEELSEQDLLLIDRFVTGVSTLEEVRHVEERKSDPVFAERLAFMQSAQRVIGYHEEQFLRQEFRNVDSRGTTERPAKNYTIWIVVGIIIGLLILVLVKILRPTHSTLQQYYAEYYEPMPNLVAPIEQGPGATSPYDEAFRNYERKQYAEAVRKFESLPTQNAASRFYYALALLAQGEAIRSIAMLKSAAGETNSEYHQAAQWYLILAYLKAANQASAQTELTEILGQPNHRYYKKAEELDRAMN